MHKSQLNPLLDLQVGEAANTSYESGDTGCTSGRKGHFCVVSSLERGGGTVVV